MRAPIWIVRSLYTSEYGVNEPKGLAFSSAANSFLLLDEAGNITSVTMGEDLAGSGVISEVQADPLNAAFDDRTGSLFVFNRGKSELAQIKADGKGLPDTSAPATRFAVHAFGIADPQGIAFDSATGRLFILDAGNSQIVSVAAHPTLGFDTNEAIRSNKVERISLKKFGKGLLKGIAYNPENGHLYVSEPGQKKLYELTQSGDLVSTFDLAALGINSPSAMTFAPSVDNTDDPNIYDLFVLDTSALSTDSQIVELSLEAPAALPPGTLLLPASLVQTIDTSIWTPPSPDPAGVDYLRALAVPQATDWVARTVALGAPSVRFNPSPFRPGGDQGSRAFDASFAADSYRRVADYAGEEGVTVLIENHFGISQDVDNVVAILRAADRANFRALADYGNSPAATTAERIASVGKLFPYLAFVSAMGTAFDDEMRHVAYDFGALVRATEASGYRGLYSIELWPDANQKPPADPIRAALSLKDELLANLLR